jgi:putative FmdB family regulatory protein
MPLYEFQCTECHSSFEELVRVPQVSAAAVVADVVCPKCGSHEVRRKVSLFASKSSAGSSFSASASSCSTGGT